MLLLPPLIAPTPRRQRNPIAAGALARHGWAAVTATVPLGARPAQL